MKYRLIAITGSLLGVGLFLAGLQQIGRNSPVAGAALQRPPVAQRPASSRSPREESPGVAPALPPPPAAAPQPAHPSLTAAFPEISSTVGDWHRFNRAARQITVAPYRDLPIRFEVVRVKDEPGYVTWIGTNRGIPGSSLVAVATPAGGYHAVVTIPGSSQFFIDSGPEGVTNVSENQPGEEGCGVEPRQPDRPTGQAPMMAATFRAQYTAAISPAGLGYDAYGGTWFVADPPKAEANALNVDVLALYDKDCLDPSKWSRTVLQNPDGSLQPVPANVPDFIDGRCKAIIEFGNVVLANSAITNFQWRYLGALAAPDYTRASSNTDLGADLSAISGNGSVGDQVRALEYQYGADQIFLWRGDLTGVTVTGVAQGAKQQPASAHGGRSVLVWGASPKAVIHELAHNFGASHDRINANVFLGFSSAGAPDGDGFYAYGMGWRNDPQTTTYTIPAGTVVTDFHNGNLTFSEPDGTQVYGFSRDVWYGVSDIHPPGPDGSYTLTNTRYNTASTIMGYGSSVIPYFSNPNITVEVTSKLAGNDNVGYFNWGTQAIGVAITEPKAAFNAKVLTDNAAAMSSLSDAIEMPAITQQPADATVAAGAGISIRVTATGGGLVYQWSKDGSAISNATAATFSKDAAGMADAGHYAVVITNRVGTITSSAATVTVTAAVTPPPAVVSSAPTGGGGGGAPSGWFLAALASLALRRLAHRRRLAKGPAEVALI